MLILFLALTGMSAVDLIAGTIWTVVAFGQTQQHIFSEGEAVSVEREVSRSLAGIKQRLKAGQWGQMVPVLLVIEGFVGMLVFGALAAWLGLENRLLAALIVAVALYALVRTVIAFARA